MVGKFKSIRLDNYKPLREIVFEVLRQAIISGDLKPGERLMEVQLAEEMGVSRTPVREAIRKLELEGLVVMIPRKGAYVAGLSLKDAADVFEIRQALEGLAAALAAERITEEEIESLEKILVEINEAAEKEDVDMVIKKDAEFHQILFKATRNDRLVQIINNLKEQIDRFRVQSFTNKARIKSLMEEHKKIVEAITERNVELAKKLAEEHIEKVENNVMNILRKEMNMMEDDLPC
ncbi:transcriptional regulator, GntR family [Caldanaerovirga acetigignens]|uniref:Transcriptional regulator, GntR family n=1 Tax=Caldanaerovirga acetigignens TaxID=447595 RepID=A0A1M7GVK6_9FIRM|nr:GntR family transcriptional regulator [Caldanaerovirga acetigignens]SHM20176.1 transcriptional regulator, GntR family [Caldanaerovirga acetigignens]